MLITIQFKHLAALEQRDLWCVPTAASPHRLRVNTLILFIGTPVLSVGIVLFLLESFINKG